MVTLNTCYTLQFYTGLEADTKPLGVPNGSMFLEMDTGKLYRFDEENQTWLDQANPTPSGGNDMFFVKFTKSGGDFSADKTFAEITAAFEDGQIPIGLDVTTPSEVAVYAVSLISDSAIYFRDTMCDNAGVYTTTLSIDSDDVVYKIEAEYPPSGGETT